MFSKSSDSGYLKAMQSLPSVTTSGDAPDLRHQRPIGYGQRSDQVLG
jgi:hypothetical protein